MLNQTRIAKKDVAPHSKLKSKLSSKPAPSKPRYENTCTPQKWSDTTDNSPKEDSLTKSLRVVTANEKVRL